MHSPYNSLALQRMICVQRYHLIRIEKSSQPGFNVTREIRSLKGHHLLINAAFCHIRAPLPEKLGTIIEETWDNYRGKWGQLSGKMKPTVYTPVRQG